MKIPTITILLVSFLINPVWSTERQPVVQFQVSPLIQARLIIADRMVLASINNQAPKTIAAVEPSLWREYSNGYLRFGDFNGDKIQDLAILTSISYGGTNPCYHVYYYNAQQQQFLRSAEPTRCHLG